MLLMCLHVIANILSIVKSSVTSKNLKNHKLASLTSKENKLNAIICKKQLRANLMKYSHTACFPPTMSRWTKAIKNNNFLSWPGLTTNLVKKYLPTTIVTVQGHLHKERQHLQSTKKPLDKNLETDKDNIDDFLNSPSPNAKMNPSCMHPDRL